MSIVDEVRTRNVAINFTVAQPIYVHDNFELQTNCPISGMVRVKDNVDNRVYWLNIDHVTWIGPR